MRIRDAGAGDADAVARIWNHYVRETDVTFNSVEKTPAEVAGLIAARQEAGRAFLVAEARVVIGFATYVQFRNGAGYARTMEHTILLDPGARRQGAGRGLMATIEAHARKGGAGSLWAGVSSGNPEGRAFHAALGYREVAVLPEVGWKRDRWFDLHLMRKAL